jgi:RNA polymerase sigma factor (sigma-70 family)
MLQAVEGQAHETTAPDGGDEEEPPGRRASAKAPPGRRTRRRILSVEECMRNPDDRNMLEQGAVGAHRDDPDSRILERELEQALRGILNKLVGNERKILTLHYGLGGKPPMTLQAIGATIGLTRERVRQIERRALDRARRLLQQGHS